MITFENWERWEAVLRVLEGLVFRSSVVIREVSGWGGLIVSLREVGDILEGICVIREFDLIRVCVLVVSCFLRRFVVKVFVGMGRWRVRGSGFLRRVFFVVR